MINGRRVSVLMLSIKIQTSFTDHSLSIYFSLFYNSFCFRYVGLWAKCCPQNLLEIIWCQLKCEKKETVNLVTNTFLVFASEMMVNRPLFSSPALWHNNEIIFSTHWQPYHFKPPAVFASLMSSECIHWLMDSNKPCFALNTSSQTHQSAQKNVFIVRKIQTHHSATLFFDTKWYFPNDMRYWKL